MTSPAASAKLTFTGRNVAIFGTRGPGCGSFQVFVDGALRATADAHASTTGYRRMLFRFGWNAAVQHTVRVVNVATAGHPRTDLDGFAILH